VFAGTKAEHCWRRSSLARPLPSERRRITYAWKIMLP